MCRNAQRLALLTPTLRQPHPYQATPNNHAQTLLDHPCFRVRKNLETDRPNWKLTQMDVGHDNVGSLIRPPLPRVACPAQAQGHPFAVLHYNYHAANSPVTAHTNFNKIRFLRMPTSPETPAALESRIWSSKGPVPQHLCNPKDFQQCDSNQDRHR